jgi:hypothetical protein
MAYSVYRSHTIVSKIRRYLSLVIIAVLIAAGAGGYLIYKKLSIPGPIPRDIIKTASFSIFYLPNEDPLKGKWVIDRQSVSYDTNTKVLFATYNTTDNKIIVSQQATPDAFKDIPQYYSKLLDRFHQYKDINTAIGTVTLTHPEELKGKQSAVAHVKDTLLFANPDKDLSDEEWKDFFRAFEIIR